MSNKTPAPKLIAIGGHVLDKTYMMPDSYNALRKELHDNWPNLWQEVQGLMAFDGPGFILTMDNALNLVTQFDTDNVDGMCKKFLDELRQIRGLSRLHNPSEYNNNSTMETSVREARQANEVAPWKQEPPRQ